MPIVGGEGNVIAYIKRTDFSKTYLNIFLLGPIGVIVSPSRELAKQTAEVMEHFTNIMYKEGLPSLRVLCCIGGEDSRQQMEVIGRGVHMIAATPGRLNDFLNKKKLLFSICKYICLDEADR